MRSNKEEKVSSTTTETAVSIVLDIDETLAYGLEGFAQKRLKSDYKWFVDNKLVIRAGGHPHILHPGCVEFIQYLFSLHAVNVSFFSNGPAERNSAFVEGLLVRALGNSGYSKIKNNVLVLSRDSIEIVDKLQIEKQNNTYGIPLGKYKKNLNRLTNGNGLKTTILIDDDETYIYPGQEKNFLKVKRTGQTELELQSYRYIDDNYFERVNHLFYLSGLLHKLLSLGRSSITANLFNLQFKKVDDSAFLPEYHQLCEERQYYIDGLAELKKFNSALNFYGGDININRYFKSLLIENSGNMNQSIVMKSNITASNDCKDEMNYTRNKSEASFFKQVFDGEKKQSSSSSEENDKTTKPAIITCSIL